MPCLKLTLIIIGAVLEVGGLLLTASPELSPRVQRGAAALRRGGAKLESRVRRLLRRNKDVTVHVGAADSFTVTDHVSVLQSVSDEADLEAKLGFLLRQAQRNQERLNEVEHRLTDLPADWRKDVEATRSALEERIAQELEQQRELFIGRRLLGLGCIATGSVVLAVVNLL